MPEYRLYILNEQGGIVRSVDFACLHDAEAIEMARDRCGGADAELWQYAPVVARIQPPVGTTRP